MTEAKRPTRMIAFMPRLLEEVREVATPQGLTVGEWLRSLVRRELARLAAEKPKKGKAK